MALTHTRGITEDGIDYYKKAGLLFGDKETEQHTSTVYTRCRLSLNSLALGCTG